MERPIPVMDPVDAMVRARSLHGYAELLTSLGGNVDRALRDAGLSREDLQQADRWVSLRKVFNAYDQACAQTGDRTFALQLSQQKDLAYLGPIALLARHAATTGDALRDVARFISVQNTGLSICLEHKGGLATLRFTILDSLRGSANQWMEDTLARACQFWTQIGSTALEPVAVHLRHGPENPVSIYHQAYGGGVQFNQSQDALIFPAQELSRPTRLSDTQTHRFLSQLLAGKDPGEQISSNVTILLDTLIPMQKGSLDVVAGELQLHPRTLQRVLRKSGVSFNELLERQKRQLAEQLLNQPGLTYLDIAHYLGYADQSAFNHAFRRWHGCSPGEWKQGVE